MDKSSSLKTSIADLIAYHKELDNQVQAERYKSLKKDFLILELEDMLQKLQKDLAAREEAIGG